MVKATGSSRKRRQSPTPYPELALLLKERRVQLGLSQSFVAAKTGINQSTLSCWERGAKVPSGPLLFQLADYLGIDRSALVAVTKRPA